MNPESKVTKKECHHHATKSMSKPTRLFKKRKKLGSLATGNMQTITPLENSYNNKLHPSVKN